METTTRRPHFHAYYGKEKTRGNHQARDALGEKTTRRAFLKANYHDVSVGASPSPALLEWAVAEAIGRGENVVARKCGRLQVEDHHAI